VLVKVASAKGHSQVTQQWLITCACAYHVAKHEKTKTYVSQISNLSIM